MNIFRTTLISILWVSFLYSELITLTGKVIDEFGYSDSSNIEIKVLSKEDLEKAAKAIEEDEEEEEEEDEESEEEE